MNPFIHTVTLYNRTENADGESVWRKTVLKNVYQSRQTKLAVADGAKSLIKVNFLMIPKHGGYVSPDKYDGDGFTLQVGDIVVSGEISDDIPDADSGNNLIKKYGERAWVIKTVSDNTMPGMRTAHYYAADC